MDFLNIAELIKVLKIISDESKEQTFLLTQILDELKEKKVSKKRH